ncbi:MAG: hypothetical protein HY040_17305 [Planctomycetes bacterium]|nr:hypothetical protein [Planctomycetota bacterium]
MPEPRAAIPPPTVPPSMLFCDGVIVEQGTSKTTLVGTFSAVAAPDFPSPPLDLHVFVQLTSSVGLMPVRLSCYRIDIADPVEVYSTTHAVSFRGKLFVEQLHLVWKQFQFPAPGEYAFELWSQNQCIAERRLKVRLKGDQSESTQEDPDT